MSIKSSPFGKVVLTGEDAARFIRHMNEDTEPPCPGVIGERKEAYGKYGHNKKPPNGGFQEAIKSNQ